MGRSDVIAAKAEELLIPVTENFGVTVYDVEYVLENGERYLRAYIDKEGGVTIDDCENVSRAFEKALDDSGLIDDQYILEVSSPGLGRALTKDRHLENSLGEEVEIKLYKPVNKEKEFVGRLKAYNKEEIVICNDEGEDLRFKRTDISLIRLTFDF